MAVTLAQLKAGTSDKIAQGVISELQANSLLLDRLTFDDCVSANGGSNLTYGYNRVKTASTAAWRELNAEFAASEAETEKVTTDLGILGGSYKIDRVNANASSGAPVDQVVMQLEEKRKATIRSFNDAVINGTKAANKWDGLKTALKNSSTEKTATVDTKTFASIKANALEWAYEFNLWLASLTRTPDMLLVNANTKAKLGTIANVLGQYQTQTSDAGVVYPIFAGIAIEDLGPGAKDGKPVVADGDIYAVCLGMSEFHGVTLDGGNGLRVYTPNFEAEGAVHEGSVEFVCGTALKATRAAGVFHEKTA